MALVPMRQAAKELGIDHANLSHYYHKGKLTGVPAGGVILIDPTEAHKELSDAGFFQRLEARKSRKRSAKATKE